MKLDKYNKLRRALRNHPLLWDEGEKGEQVSRLLDKTSDILSPSWNERRRALKTAALEKWFLIQ